jgi:SAM domain (Sterile alpha motif)
VAAGEQSVDIAAWLHGLGLQQYEQAFRENDVDAEVLPELTADNLTASLARARNRRADLTTISSAKSPSPAGDPSAALSTLRHRRSLPQPKGPLLRRKVASCCAEHS